MSDDTLPIRWGILGTARIAEKIAVAIRQSTGGVLQAIGSRDVARAARWQAKHDVVQAHGSYQEVLDNPEVDAVYIPLPPSMHREWTIRAAERGKHVLCEKPLALSAAEGEEMLAACRENDVQLMDGVMWLHHPRAAAMRAILQEGTLGELRRVTSAFTLRWEKLPEGEFRLDRKLGGGSLLDLGWYCCGAALWAFQELPQRVLGHARFHDETDLSFSGTMWFSENRVASFDCGFETVLRRWLEIAGTTGSLVCDDFVRPAKQDRPRFWTHDSTGASREHVTSPPIQEVCMIDHFQRIVRSGARDDTWPRISLQTQRVCDALDSSARSGRIVELS